MWAQNVRLFEDIQNIASHREFGASVKPDRLGRSRSRDAKGCGVGFAAKAAMVAVLAPSKRSAGVKNPELRRIIEQMYRKIQ
jgi:hypothetical protein